MGTTRQIGRAEWQSYFERFNRQQLAANAPESATIEVVSPKLGDQIDASAARLLGLVYDPPTNAFRVLLEDLDHLVFYPTEIWVMEEEGGFISNVELERPDGGKEIIHIQRSGPPARRYEQPPSTPP